MNNKNLESLYGGDFNNIQNMLAEDVSDTSDYNVSLLNQLQQNHVSNDNVSNDNVSNDKSGGFGLGNLVKLGTNFERAIKTGTSMINKGQELASQASKVINKVESTASEASSLVDKFKGSNNEKKVNNCITIAQSMKAPDIQKLIEELQKILATKNISN
jgi:hypothetical protein